MNRRTFLAWGGAALAGLAAPACSARRQPLIVRAPLVRLPPVNVAWDRIIRTTVGLRPHRP